MEIGWVFSLRLSSKSGETIAAAAALFMIICFIITRNLCNSTGAWRWWSRSQVQISPLSGQEIIENWFAVIVVVVLQTCSCSVVGEGVNLGVVFFILGPSFLQEYAAQHPILLQIHKPLTHELERCTYRVLNCDHYLALILNWKMLLTWDEFLGKDSALVRRYSCMIQSVRMPWGGFPW